ncbi:lipase 1-like isoform X4 [Diabrotica virgifera virgifera]|uniref:Partial AB-hydrolase lipase domain-containing protein n=1 Tax=Diabrotica virgifera virgifera TaxID=50390 RepID=A0ABM5L662_DIAVI|nr:lipase 1-like isoform X4 [Diabrotica virgifera virgifera]
MTFKKNVIVAFCVYLFVFVCESKYSPRYNVMELTNQLGLTAELHNVTTEDGYILKIFRIKAINGKEQENREPVLLQHGLLGSSEQFLHAKNNSLALILFNNGFDVWLGNSRGNFHSRKHVSLDPDRDKEFWFYTLDQMGQYDQPAVIDHILKTTGKQQISYIGHSQGGGSLLAMASGRPEYNQKIKIFVGLAPAAYMKHNRHPLLVISKYFADLLKSLAPEIFTTTPAGMSFFQILHYAKMHIHGTFEKYDWGPEMNLQKYNSTVAPKYDWSKITCPTVLIYGLSDALVNHKDIKYIAKKLPNLIELYKVADDRFNHLDFLWSNNITPLLHDKVLTILNNYRS